MANPSRFTSGVSTAAPSAPLGALPIPDPTKIVGIYEDFHRYAAGDWTVTETQAGATEALADAFGGALLITNTDTENDVVAMQYVKESLTIRAGYKAWFTARFQCNDVDQNDIIFGLYVTDTDPLAGVTDGIYFISVDGSASVDLYVRVDDAVAVSSTGLGTLVDATNMRVDWYYDGGTTVTGYIDGVAKASLTLTAAQLAALDDETLALSLAMYAGEAAANTLQVDWIGAWTER